MAKTESASQQESNSSLNAATNTYASLTASLARLKISFADYGLLLILSLITLLSVIIIALFVPIFEPGIPKGYSTLIHFFKVSDIRQSFTEFGTYIDWSESWYGGHHQFLFYPPLFYFLAASVDVVVNDLILTSKIMAVSGTIVATITAYLLTYAVFPQTSKLWHRALASMAGGLIFGINPSLVTFIITRGKYPDYWAIAVAPISMIFLVNWLKYKRDRIPYGFAIMTAITLLIHIDMAATLLVIAVVFTYTYLKVDLGSRGRLFDREMNQPLLKLGVSFFAFAGLSAFFWFPYLNYIDKIGAASQLFPSRLPISVDAYFRGNFSFSRTRYPGVIAILIALIALLPPIKKFRKEIYSWISVLITGILLLMMQYTFIFEAMPELHTLFFRTAMVVIVMSLAVLAGIACLILLETDWGPAFKRFKPLLLVRRLVPFVMTSVIIVLLFAIFYDSAYVFSRDFMRPREMFTGKGEISQVRKVLRDAETKDTGRVLAIANSTPETTYLPAVIGKPIINGFEAQTSRTADDLDILKNTLIKNKSSQKSLLKRLDRWGVEYVYINKEFFEEGFNNLESIDRLTPIFKGNRYQVYKYDGRGYVMPEEPVLALGSEFSITEEVFGKVTEMGLVKEENILIDSYELSDLQSFESIILNGVEVNDIKKSEKKLKEYIAGGGRLIIATDNGFSNIFSGDTFLDAKIIKDEFAPGVISVGYQDDNAEYKIKNDSEWIGSYFEGPIESLATVNGRTVVGKRKIGDGEVIFIGYNLIYHAAYTENRNELGLLQGLLEGENEDHLTKINYKLEQSVPGIKKIDVASSDETWVSIPMSWSPYWQVFVDDVRVKTRSLGNVITFHLPKGDHEVILKYQMTSLHKGSIILSFFTLILVIFTPQLRRKMRGLLSKWA